jgi:predicted hydrolase (HD superfamily)
MPLPTRDQSEKLLREHVKDAYQLYHARMVATEMAGYAEIFAQDAELWYATGLLHDIDFEEYPKVHPGESLKWFKQWGLPGELIHAVEAHAYGYNGFTTLPETKLAATLMACDEISGIFYAYRKLNPVPYGEMKPSSILKRLKEKSFAAAIERETIYRGCEALGVRVEEHINNLIKFLKNFS